MERLHRLQKYLYVTVVINEDGTNSVGNVKDRETVFPAEAVPIVSSLAFTFTNSVSAFNE